MKIVDTNVLIYAVNSDAANHDVARSWLDRCLSGGDTVGFAWQALLGFVRLTTNRAVLPTVLTADNAIAYVTAWLSAPSAFLVNPGSTHLALLTRLLAGTRAADLVPDAHLAALALEHRATLVTYDRDFARFEGLSVASPADLQ